MDFEKKQEQLEKEITNERGWLGHAIQEHEDSHPIELQNGQETSTDKSGRPAKLPAKSKIKSIPETAFNNTQLTLFQTFLCNTEEERNQLSNTMELWDSIPKFSVSRQAQNKLRSPNGNLTLWKHDFLYRKKPLRVVIQPAKIEEMDASGKLIEKEYYPSASEELIEDALRKLASNQSSGYFHQSDYRSGVVFSLHMLREELAQRGHSKSYYEITMSLQILAKSIIEIHASDDSEDGFAASAYLPALAGVNRKTFESNPDAKWVAQFHPLITQSIERINYRQYNYQQMMSNTSQLARWLNKLLINKYTYAELGNSFKLKYSTIKRDSALLNSYERNRDGIDAADKAFKELIKNHVVMEIDKQVELGIRNKILDAEYVILPTREFIKMTKAANKKAKKLGAVTLDE